LVILLMKNSSHNVAKVRKKLLISPIETDF